MPSRTKGPKPSLYGFSFRVGLMSRSVRPWNAVLNETSHGFFVDARAIFTAFSIASEPEVRKMDFVRPGGELPAIRAASGVDGAPASRRTPGGPTHLLFRSPPPTAPPPGGPRSTPASLGKGGRVLAFPGES